MKAEGKDWTFKVDKSTVLTSRGAGKAQAKAEAAGQAGVKFACGTNNAGAGDLGRNEYCAEMIRACDLRPEHF